MRGALVVLILCGVAAIGVPAATAQSHGHGAAGPVLIAAEAPSSGAVMAGGLSHFTVLDVGDDEVPDFHQQNRIRVSNNGVVLFETTADSGHDYDGVLPFAVTFPAAGQYRVEAVGDDGEAIATLEGPVHTAPERVAQAVLEGPAEVPVRIGDPVRYTYRAQGRDTLPHTDALFEVRQGETLWFRARTHATDGAHAMQFAFPQPGDYVVRVTLFQALATERYLFAPAVAEQAVTVLDAGGALAGTLSPDRPPLPQAALNAVVEGTGGDGYSIVGTYDPYTVVGPSTQQHLAVLVDATPGLFGLFDRADDPHQVDFVTRITGPDGLLKAAFASREYDGVLEVATMQSLPGIYHLHSEATSGNWTGRIDMAYEVAPPALAVPTVAFAAGPQFFTVSGLEGLRAGVPGQFRIEGRDALGNPFAHGELDLQVRNATGVALLQAKLHTHDDGAFAWNLTFPQAGAYSLWVSPFPLLPHPAGPFYGEAVGEPLRLAVEVGEGPGIPAQAPVPRESRSEATPGLPALAALAAVGALVLRRRGR
jgi:hypothetical protein